MTQKARPSRRDAARRRDRETSPNRWILPALGVGVVLAAAIGAILLTQGSNEPQPSAPVGGATDGTPAVVTGTSLIALPDEGADPAVGQAAPFVEGVDFHGNPVSIAADGRPKVILFLSHSCPHCQREVPVVQEWLDGGGLPEDVDFLSVATNIDPSQPNYPPAAWLEREGWTPPVIADPDYAVLQAYGLNAFPFWAFVDAEGKIVERTVGELTPQDIETRIEALRAG